MKTETTLDYQSFRCQRLVMAQPVWALLLLVLVRTGVGLPPQGLVFSYSEMELSHLVVDETLDIAHILPCVGHRNALLSTPWKKPISTGNTRMIGQVQVTRTENPGYLATGKINTLPQGNLSSPSLSLVMQFRSSLTFPPLACC